MENADGQKRNMPWAAFSRRPNYEGLVCPTDRRSAFSTHHDGRHPRHTVARVRTGHPIREEAAPRGSRTPPSH